MCGLAGLFVPGLMLHPDDLAARARTMAESLSHRGPDDNGLWEDRQAGLAMGFRRLSIQDLSQAGHQPMVSSAGQWVVCLNGEIFNHLDLRREIASQPWKGHSDAETLAALLDEWGLEKTLPKLNGFFALALWSVADRTLVLARDRLGVKPIALTKVLGGVAWASEVRAFERLPEFDRTINQAAVREMLSRFYIPSPLSIYASVERLMPGEVRTIRRDLSSSSHPFWSLQPPEIQKISYRQAVEQADELLTQSVRRRLLSDVPLGSFLSGGIDSTLIAIKAQELSSKKLQTFTMGFEEAAFDESPHARAIAEFLGTEHHEIRLSNQNLLDVVTDLPNIYDEPFADGSQIPTVALCRFTRQHVTVALSGDGGDELFDGYERYELAEILWQHRRAFRSMRPFFPFMAKRLGFRGVPYLMRYPSILTAKNPEEMYDVAMSPGLMDGLIEPSPATRPVECFQTKDLRYEFRRNDLHRYLPDDLLVKIDRASMSCGLEVREPFLDHELVEFAFGVPSEHHKNKRILKTLLQRKLPKKLWKRPKKGFAAPMSIWLRGGLRDWAEAVLTPESMANVPYLRADKVRELWAEHQSGEQNHPNTFMPILMLLAWHEKRR